MFTRASKASGQGPRILVVRLSSMGDVIHALPAAATLKHSFPGSELVWVINPRWAELLVDNPFVDRLILFSRHGLIDILAARRALRRRHFDFAVDVQGLIQSALVASAARPDRIYGFHQSLLREKLAALFYSTRVRAQSAHVVDRNLELAAAAGATNILRAFPLPSGTPEGVLPDDRFVLACPLAGWGSKQWPLENYSALARRLRRELGMALVLNGPPQAEAMLRAVEGAEAHISGIPGLIHASRRSTAVVGIDSGPMHLAAALGKPGVAIFGPTDPARNGPCGPSFDVLRSPSAHTTYQRHTEIDPSMHDISPDMVFEALRARVRAVEASA